MSRVLTEKALRDGLTERSRRRVSNDNVVSIGGVEWQLDQGYLSGCVVTVAQSFARSDEAPWVEHEGKRLILHPVDAKANSKTRRAPRGQERIQPTQKRDFDPNRALMSAEQRPQEDGGSAQ
jgi:hypothetical protein